MNYDLLLRIKSFNSKREQQVLPLKYAAMTENPFRFFRGTCHLFYEDLLSNYSLPDSPLSWICGDLHIENFGSYKGQNRLVYFDMNDFDEAILAPVLFEMARLVVSVGLAAKEIRFSKNETNRLIHQLLQQYRKTLEKNKALNIERETGKGLIKKLVKKVSGRKEKDLLAQRTNNKQQNAKLLFSSRLLALQKEEKQQLSTAFNQWFGNVHNSLYSVTDAGFRIAGTGSIGTQRYCVLLENKDNSRQKIVADVKQALPSSLSAYTKLTQPKWPNEAERIITIQRMMQHETPDLLSAFEFDSTWFVVREIQPTEDKISVDQAKKQPRHVEQYIADLGMLSASAQLRSSGRQGSANADAFRSFALGEDWVKPVLDWCTYYMDKVEKDYKTFCKGYRDGSFT